MCLGFEFFLELGQEFGLFLSPGLLGLSVGGNEVAKCRGRATNESNSPEIFGGGYVFQKEPVDGQKHKKHPGSDPDDAIFMSAQ